MSVIYFYFWTAFYLQYANLHWRNCMRNNTYSLFQSNNSFSFICKARHAGRRSKAIPSGMNAAVSPSANHWIMLIASDEWYYSVTPATLMAIHLAPSLPVISQPHVFWERVGGEGQTGVDVSRAFVHHPFRSEGQGLYVHVFRIMPCFRNQPRPPFIRTVDTNTCSARCGAGTHDAKLIISWINAMK